MKYFIKYAILKIKSATDRRLVLEFKQKNNRSIPRSLAVIFLHLQYLFHKIPIKGFYVSQGPTAYRYGDTIKILTYLRYSINRLQYKTEHILKEI